THRAPDAHRRGRGQAGDQNHFAHDAFHSAHRADRGGRAFGAAPDAGVRKITTRGPSMRILFCLACCLFLAACAPMREQKVQPLTSAVDESAMQAGELRIAASALASGDLDVAISLYTRITASRPDIIGGWLGLADAMYLAGDMTQARR